MAIRESQTAPNMIAKSSRFSQSDGASPGRLPIFSGAGTTALKGQNRALIAVEATVYWWRTDQAKSSNSGNKFCVMPAEAVRFRCIGSLTPKYPRRIRVDFAQALDRLPELTGAELKALGASLATAISKKLGVDVAPLNGQSIDLCVGAWDLPAHDENRSGVKIGGNLKLLKGFLDVLA